MAKSSENSIWLYQPSFPLAIVFAALYLIPMLWQLYLAVFKHKSCYFIVVTIGAALEVGGYIARAVSIKHDTEIVSTPQTSPLPIKNETDHSQ